MAMSRAVSACTAKNVGSGHQSHISQMIIKKDDMQQLRHAAASECSLIVPERAFARLNTSRADHPGHIANLYIPIKMSRVHLLARHALITDKYGLCRGGLPVVVEDW